MSFLEVYYLYFIIIGLFFMSVSLHFKTEGKDLKYGFFGWAESLTNYGRFYFFIGLLIAFLGAYSGT